MAEEEIQSAFQGQAHKFQDSCLLFFDQVLHWLTRLGRADKEIDVDVIGSSRVGHYPAIREEGIRPTVDVAAQPDVEPVRQGEDGGEEGEGSAVQ